MVARASGRQRQAALALQGDNGTQAPPQKTSGQGLKANPYRGTEKKHFLHHRARTDNWT